jgi:hypothetical protein
MVTFIATTRRNVQRLTRDINLFQKVYPEMNDIECLRKKLYVSKFSEVLTNASVLFGIYLTNLCVTHTIKFRFRHSFDTDFGMR